MLAAAGIDEQRGLVFESSSLTWVLEAAAVTGHDRENNGARGERPADQSP
jgi:hypothetical protein